MLFIKTRYRGSKIKSVVGTVGMNGKSVIKIP